MIFGNCVLCGNPLDPSPVDRYQPDYALLEMWVGEDIVKSCVHPRCRQAVQERVDEQNRTNLEKADGKETK